MIYDVTVKRADGNGLYFDFTFELNNPDGKISNLFECTLYPFNEPRLPQKKLVYANLNLNEGLSSNSEDFIKFTAPMPKGYKAACQIASQEWVGLKGKLFISTKDNKNDEVQ